MVISASQRQAFTAAGDPRGYIQPATLEELWFHTGTACNLKCPFCLEGSKPGDHRLQQITLADAAPFIEEALKLGVQQFSFTGGEPFINKDMIDILACALEYRPCLVLTNGTRPLQKRMERLIPLLEKPNPVKFRVSLDSPDPKQHDKFRGEGSFALAMESLARLHQQGFGVSVARQSTPQEDTAAVNARYQQHFRAAGVSVDLNIIAFPDLYRPFSHPDGIPEITENCMTTYHSEASRAQFMCAFSKMVVKMDGAMRVYPCTLVDDDPEYDMGGTLKEAMGARVMLRHHRCFSCFSCGASCSER